MRVVVRQRFYCTTYSTTTRGILANGKNCDCFLHVNIFIFKKSHIFSLIDHDQKVGTVKEEDTAVP